MKTLVLVLAFGTGAVFGSVGGFMTGNAGAENYSCRQAVRVADQILEIQKSAGRTSARAITAAGAGDQAELDRTAAEFGRNAELLGPLETEYNRLNQECEQ